MITTRIFHGPHRAIVVAVLLYAAAGVFSNAHAQQVNTNITADGTLGTRVTPAAGNVFNIDGGTIKGANQFHSFGQFSVGTGNTANFSVANTIQNIISRITGGVRSEIDGTLRSTISGTPTVSSANLFLLNPAGILFGQNARLDIGGSFHATTADFIKLGTEGIFYADTAKASVLTSAPPSAFGFLTSNPAAIDVQTGVFSNNTFTNRLQVLQGQVLSLVGGPVNVGAPTGQPAAGFVFAPGGVVNIASVASPGEATLAGGINVDAFAKLGEIRITGGAFVDGREINIRGGRLEITNATLFPGVSFRAGLPGAPAPNGGQVSIRVTDDVTITGTGTSTIGIQTFAGSSTAPTLVPSDVPGVNIQAGRLSMSGTAGIVTNRFGPGNPSTVAITADTIELRNGASIAMANSFGGGTFPTGGGTFTINGNNMTLSSDGSPRFTAIGATGNFHPAYGQASVAGVPVPAAVRFAPFLQLADSASVTINLTGTLTVRGNAGITTDNFGFGRSGAININAANMLFVGAGRIVAQAIGGESGSVRLTATGKIDVQNGFLVSANTLGAGNGGIVELTAGESITLTGADSRILSGTAQASEQQLNANGFAQRFSPFFQNRFGTPTPDYASLRKALGVEPALGDLMQVLAKLHEITDSAGNPLVSITDFTPGNGGTISITNTPLLTMNADTRIETSTGWNGNAGAVVANVGSLFLNDGAAIRSRSGIELLTGEPSVGAGDAGEINLGANNAISISGRSPTSGTTTAVSTTTFGDGNAGNISLSANRVDVQNGGGVTSESGGTLAGQFLVGSGNAGQVNVSTPTLAMDNGGAISVTTSGAGNAGNIVLKVGNFTQAGEARVDSSTLGAGRGGDVTVTADSVSISGPRTGLFSTASGSGAGGNIKIQAGQLVQLSNEGTLSAQSTGTATATAGDININTPTFQSQNASVMTGATLADGGNISISTTGSTVQLTDSQITTSVLGGVGNGGNIAIDSKLIVLNDSQILARAVRGHGGNITITGDVFLVNSGGRAPVSLAGIVDASSELSTPGTIDIEATFTNVTGTFAQLPGTPLQAAELLRASCAARFAGGKASSLVVGGRDGLPLQPGDLLPSPLYVASEADTPLTGPKITGYDQSLRFSLLGSKDRVMNQYSLLPNAKCSL